jgi:hypothetical protein
MTDRLKVGEFTRHPSEIKRFEDSTKLCTANLQNIPVKGKVHPEHATKTKEVQLYSFFNLDARQVSVIKTTPRPLYPRERPGIHCIGG